MTAMFRKWLDDTRAVAAVEAGLLFPVLLTILCGSIDLGQALILNQKVIGASQIVADILGREMDVSDAELQDTLAAARMALTPYSSASLGMDVAGIQYVGTGLVPTVRWRDTFSMSPNPAVIEGSQGLGRQNEGVIAVTVKYQFEPYFTRTFGTGFEMEEVAYVRGRKGMFITRGQE